jgi:hypothetical protein
MMNRRVPRAYVENGEIVEIVEYLTDWTIDIVFNKDI